MKWVDSIRLTPMYHWTDQSIKTELKKPEIEILLLINECYMKNRSFGLFPF